VKREWHLVKQNLTQLVLSSAVWIRWISINWACKIIAVIFSLAIAKCSNESECWKFFGMCDWRPVTIAAALASDNVTLQHWRPAVSLRSLSQAVEFRKGIRLKLVLFVLNFFCYTLRCLRWHNKPKFLQFKGRLMLWTLWLRWSSFRIWLIVSVCSLGLAVICADDIW